MRLGGRGGWRRQTASLALMLDERAELLLEVDDDHEGGGW
jgi:hypothetical protein